MLNIKVVSSKQDQNQWMKVPFLVYKSDPNWIPHLKQDIEKVFDSEKNKFYREGAAQRWTVLENDVAIGRIAAFHWKKYSASQDQPTGGIGFFECTRNTEAAKLLLDTACDWLKSEGMETVDGPINFGEKDAFWGLLVENFTSMNSYRMNYNPDYYRAFFEDYGFQLYYEQWCYRRDLYIPAQDVFVRKTNILMSEPGYTISNAKGKSDEQLANDFVTIYNAAWAGFAGFKNMPLQQAKNIIKAMKPVMDREIMVFVYHFDKPIAFYLNLPELNEIFQHINGNLNWWGKIKFLYYKTFAKRKTMVGIIFGVDRAYHGKGVEGAMIKWAGDHIVSLNKYEETILTWIGDFNPKMLRVVENLGSEKYRTLITYRKHFDPNKPFERYPLLS